MSFPLPTPKPSSIATQSDSGILGSARSILGDIFDTGKNVFNRIADIEMFKYENDRLADARASEEEARVNRQREYAGGTGTAGAPMINQNTVLIGGLIAAAAYMMKG